MRYVIGLLVIALCMGQSCTGLGLGSANPGTGTGDNGTGGGTTTQPAAQTKGVPQGTYSGPQTAVYTQDNLSDAYPPQTQTTTFTGPITFGSDGRIQRDDGSPIALGDIEQSGTPYGTLAEQVVSITVGENLTEYRTQAQLVMDGGTGTGLSWTLNGNGVHTYRLTGGSVAVSGRVDMQSDAVGGAVQSLTITFAGNLSK